MDGSSYTSSKIEERYDPSFTAEISSKMQVPKRIRVDGESFLFSFSYLEDVDVVGNINPKVYVYLGDNDIDPHMNSIYHSHSSRQLNHEYKYEMRVPDRILVAGNLQLLELYVNIYRLSNNQIVI